MKQLVGLVALVGALGMGAVACGGDDSLSEGDMDDLVEVIEESLGVETDVARCVADDMRAEFGDERMVEIRDSDDDWQPTDEEANALASIFLDCGAVTTGG